MKEEKKVTGDEGGEEDEERKEEEERLVRGVEAGRLIACDKLLVIWWGQETLCDDRDYPERGGQREEARFEERGKRKGKKLKTESKERV